MVRFKEKERDRDRTHETRQLLENNVLQGTSSCTRMPLNLRQVMWRQWWFPCGEGVGGEGARLPVSMLRMTVGGLWLAGLRGRPGWQLEKREGCECSQ